MLRKISYMMLLLMCVASVMVFANGAAAQKEGEPPQPPNGEMMAPPDGGQQMPDAPMPPDGPMSPDGMQQDNLRINWQALNLTDEQREKIQQLRRDFQVSTATTREELQFAQQDLRKEMSNAQIDSAKIDALLTQIASAKQKLSEGAVQNLLNIKAILTEEQLQQLAEMQEQMPVEWRGIALTKEQRSQIKNILKTSLKANQQLLETIIQLRGELREELFATNSDTAKVQQLQASIAEKDAALEKARTETMIEINKLLTPEQREQLKKASAERKQDRQERIQERVKERQNKRAPQK
ncbi:P pilus assembly/Cpx signaling pathway [Candidatus Moduliflexus flocculans]|uniref:P pilus assembly/Cpx signaling pathway n=1 Tax=Candidatus Moduliflexus flocculans TaxID=1499966 RepID=A0A0S6W171_9BACT|nr:P pilus assembly/Cpx signaling pathway [Candidatus Moduliflexus flocculans]